MYFIYERILYPTFCYDDSFINKLLLLAITFLMCSRVENIWEAFEEEEITKKGALKQLAPLLQGCLSPKSFRSFKSYETSLEQSTLPEVRLFN